MLHCVIFCTATDSVFSSDNFLAKTYLSPKSDQNTLLLSTTTPLTTPTDVQKAKIEQTAQAILDARALYPDCSLAELYDVLTMSPELREAHQQNDRAVMQVYGFDVAMTTETSCVAELMRMYQAIIQKAGDT